MTMKVSAIISAYYAEEFLEGRIRNLLDQTMVPQIVVVCQMGSEEERIANRMLPRDYSDDDPGPYPEKIITTSGIPTIYQAWNLGIDAADGEYLTSANSDDRLRDDAIEVLAGELDRRRHAVVYPDVDVVADLDGGFEGAERIHRFEWAEGGLDELLEGCFLGPCPMWRADLHSKHGLFDPTYKSAGDYEFWLRLAAGGERFYHCRDVLGIYLYRDDGAENREKNLTIWETARARAAYRKD